MKAISIVSIGALAALLAGCLNTEHRASVTEERYPWKRNIVTTVFWIGERPSRNNPVPNRRSSWDKDWTRNYGGFDDPNPAHRSNYIPVKFTPRQNPFYCALPYNDKSVNGHRPEAPRVVSAVTSLWSWCRDERALRVEDGDACFPLWEQIGCLANL